MVLRIDHGDGNQKYVVISGIVSIPISPVDSSRSTAKNDQVMMVAIVVPKLEDNIRVKARMTFTQTFISAISYSKPMPKNLALDKKDFVENEAINVSYFQFKLMLDSFYLFHEKKINLLFFS